MFGSKTWDANIDNFVYPLTGSLIKLPLKVMVHEIISTLAFLLD